MKYVFLLLGVICIFHSFMFSNNIIEFTLGITVGFGYALVACLVDKFKSLRTE